MQGMSLHATIQPAFSRLETWPSGDINEISRWRVRDNDVSLCQNWVGSKFTGN